MSIMGGPPTAGSAVLYVGTTATAHAISTALPDGAGELSIVDDPLQALARHESSDIVALVIEEVAADTVPLQSIRRRFLYIPCIIIRAGDSPETTSPVVAGEVLNVDDPVDDAKQIGQRIAARVRMYRTYLSTLDERERLTRMIDSSEDVVWMFSDDWSEVLLINESYESIFGRSVEDLTADASDFLNAIHPDDVDRVVEAMEQLSAGQEVELEYRVNEHEDYRRWVWVKAFPIFDDATVNAVAGFARDISERKRQARSRRRERDRFLALFEHFPEPTIAYRFEGGEPVIQQVNEAFTEVFGFSHAQSVDIPVDELIVPSDRIDEAKHLDDRVQRGDYVDEELVRRTADGPRQFRFRNITLHNDEKYDGFGVYADIEDRRRRERALNALHQTSRELSAATDKVSVSEIAVDAAADILALPVSGIWFYDEDADSLRPVAVSDGVSEYTDQVPSYNRGEGIAWQVYGSDRGIVYDDIRDAPERFNEDTPLRSAISIGLQDHGVFQMASVDVGAIDEVDMSLARILGANTAAALTRADREATLRRQRAALTRQNQRLEEFTSVVSHDLRTPLALATAGLEQLKANTQADGIEQIESALGRMDDIIGKTLTLARSGRMVGDTEPVSLDQFARQCFHLTGLTDLELVIDDDLPTVEADPDRLRHVFENLYRNAAEHGGVDASVYVEATDEGFAVGDDGPGIQSEQADKIFEAGFSTNPGGTGFGLTIVNRIADAHGWSIEVGTNEDGGARFEFNICD